MGANPPLFPDPTTGHFVLDIQTSEGIDHDLVVRNLLGQVAHQQAIGATRQTVVLPEVASGLYLATLHNQQGETVALRRLAVE